MNYRKVNNLMGWITGGIAYLVYLKTMEPTASFWDCGEFLSCAYKLEVGHSPGAPFFMMLQRFFGLFSGGAALTGGASTNAALFINSLSALTSGLTILFLFWTITHFAKKMLTGSDGEPDTKQMALIMGTGLVGALAYTFSDTFWFSAVEAEVYGTSSFFTAITFWAILKWENVADQKHADRWIVLIAYLIGISVCVHLLNLLTIPAVAMVYYFRRFKATKMGTATAFIIGCVILAFVQFGVIQYIPIIASKFDLFFVNTLGTPFDIGAVTFLVLLCAALVWFLMFAKKKGWYTVHVAVLCVMFIIIGYSSYLPAVIRSRADVPIDMTNPDNPLSLLSYVSREQFGEQPLLSGPDFDAQVIGINVKGYQYVQTKQGGKDHYEVVGKKYDYQFEEEKKRFFPRIYEGLESNHASFYRNFLHLAQNESPTSADNFNYFFNYQINWMWWRYFMWNYAGRQNDVEGQGEARNGNWISGIKVLDKMRVGDIDKMGDGMSNNRARNELYFLPFILGILGMVYHFNRNRKDAIVTFMLFFFTGIAIAIYLNMPPLQPRERDYAFAGSTYAFAIWIGLGVLMLNQWFEKAIKGAASAYLTIVLCLLAVPMLMAKEEWDDHDRSQKTLARATAYNTLTSLAPNAVLFTFGDNDTYPVWYMQEVEGYRRDVRIVNLSLLGIDWYIDQLNYRINDADAVSMIWKKEDYIGERRNMLRYYNNPQIPQDRYFNLAEICKFMIDDNEANKLQTQNGEKDNYLPTKNFLLPSMSKEDLVKNGLVDAADTARISNEVRFTFPKNNATKDDIAVLNILAASASQGWKRPIYFGSGMRNDDYRGLANYMRLEGTVFRVMPYTYMDPAMKNQQEIGFVDAPKCYDLFVNKFIWGGGEKKNVYFDEKNRFMFTPYRNNVPRIAEALAKMGRKDDAVKIMNVVDKNISQAAYAYNGYMLEGFDPSAYYMTVGYYQIQDEKAREGGQRVANQFSKTLEGDINWILSLSDEQKEALASDVQRDLSIMNMIGNVSRTYGDTATSKQFEQRVQTLAAKVSKSINMQGAQQQQ
ncbi:MAG: DUF2723 domain-containing protein [Bacteroidota bacterium]